jgi:hypothetical protein
LVVAETKEHICDVETTAIDIGNENWREIIDMACTSRRF